MWGGFRGQKTRNGVDLIRKWGVSFLPQIRLLSTLYVGRLDLLSGGVGFHRRFRIAFWADLAHIRGGSWMWFLFFLLPLWRDSIHPTCGVDPHLSIFFYLLMQYLGHCHTTCARPSKPTAARLCMNTLRTEEHAERRAQAGARGRAGG